MCLYLLIHYKLMLQRVVKLSYQVLESQGYSFKQGPLYDGEKFYVVADKSGQLVLDAYQLSDIQRVQMLLVLHWLHQLIYKVLFLFQEIFLMYWLLMIWPMLQMIFLVLSNMI